MLLRQNLARSVRDVVASVLYATGIVRLATFLRRRLLRSYGVYVLSYHHVVKLAVRPDGTDETTTAQLEQHLRLLTRSFEIVSLEHALDLLERDRLSKDYAVVTFDDGYEDNYKEAFPLLRRFDVPATIFLITGLVGTDEVPWYDEYRARLSGSARPATVDSVTAAVMELLKNSDPADRESVLSWSEAVREIPVTSLQLSRFRLLDWNQVREMADQGISFGSHTMTHPNLTRLDAESLRRELEISKDAIESATKRVCHALAFPNGDFDTTVLQATKRAGYRGACTQGFGSNHAGCDRFRLRRVALGDTPLPVVSLKLSGLLAPFFAGREMWSRLRWMSAGPARRRSRAEAPGRA